MTPCLHPRPCTSYAEDDVLLSRAMAFSLLFCLPVTCSTAGRKRWGKKRAASCSRIQQKHRDSCLSSLQRRIETDRHMDGEDFAAGRAQVFASQVALAAQRPWRTGTRPSTLQKLLSIVVRDEEPVSILTGVPGTSTRKSVDYKTLDPGILLTLVKTLFLPLPMSCIVRP